MKNVCVLFIGNWCFHGYHCRGLPTSNVGPWSFTLKLGKSRVDLVGHGYVLDALALLECPQGMDDYPTAHLTLHRDRYHTHR